MGQKSILIIILNQTKVWKIASRSWVYFRKKPQDGIRFANPGLLFVRKEGTGYCIKI